MANVETSLMAVEKKAVKKVKLHEIVPPLDFSFMKVEVLEDFDKEDPRGLSPLIKTAKKSADNNVIQKTNSQCLKLNNNILKDVSRLMNLATVHFKNPANISWIDLSFNFLPTIDPVFTQFEQLKILYLHGNEINDLKEINKLANCPKLTKLTLHGNAIENIKGYRFFVLAVMPNLTNFDFSIVTKGDRVTAKTFKSFYNPEKSKRVKREDEH